MSTLTRAPRAHLTASYWLLTDSFHRSLLAQGKAFRTQQTYMEAVDQLGRFLEERGMPLNVEAITREHVQEFFIDLQQRISPRSGKPMRPATVSNRFKSLQAFWKWCAEEGEVQESPMARMHPPVIPEEPPPVLTQEQLKKLLKACEGRDFMARRDMAILSLLVDTGMRRSEIAGITLADLDFPHNTVDVLGKGNRRRVCPFGHKTAQAIDRYLRARAQHPSSSLEWLWLGHSGRLTEWGIRGAMERRAKQAGVEGVHLHLWRHTFAHEYLKAGGQEGDLMRLAGWRSRSMLGRYGASAADERAREAFKKLSPRDKL